jgi:hypothetical protein
MGCRKHLSVNAIVQALLFGAQSGFTSKKNLAGILFFIYLHCNIDDLRHEGYSFGFSLGIKI